MDHPPDAEQRARALFADRFGSAPEVLARAPGRVNLMGDHTDYHDGFVLPMALERSTWIAARRRDDGRVLCHSEAFDTTAEFPLPAADARPPADGGWPGYLEGVAWALGASNGTATGWEGAVASDVPAGAGLSSSAALEMATARILLAVGGGDWDPVAAAVAGRRAENEWVGVATGIMDQLASAAAVGGHALLIDCRTLDVEAVPIPSATTVFVLDSSTRRQLTESGYDERRRECDAGAAALGVTALRDATLDMLANAAEDVGPLLEVRCRHVISENSRVRDTAAALHAGDPEAVGALMAASHRSLRDDFEISTPAMECLVRAASRAAGCYGARMTGGGFGGAAVALVDAAAAEDFVAEATAGYRSTTGLTCTIYRTDGAPGATLEPV